MYKNNQIIDQHLRRQLVRKWIIYILSTLLFVGFMSYALYKEHSLTTKDDIVTDKPERNHGEPLDFKVLILVSIVTNITKNPNNQFVQA